MVEEGLVVSSWIILSLSNVVIPHHTIGLPSSTKIWDFLWLVYVASTQARIIHMTMQFQIFRKKLPIRGHLPPPAEAHGR